MYCSTGRHPPAHFRTISRLMRMRLSSFFLKTVLKNVNAFRCPLFIDLCMIRVCTERMRSRLNKINEIYRFVDSHLIVYCFTGNKNIYDRSRVRADTPPLTHDGNKNIYDRFACVRTRPPHARFRWCTVYTTPLSANCLLGALSIHFWGF